MKYAIIISRKDEAGMNIASNLEKYDFKNNISLHYADKESIYCEDIDKSLDADGSVLKVGQRAK